MNDNCLKGWIMHVLRYKNVLKSIEFIIKIN